MSLDDQKLLRYSRQILLPEIDLEGQQQLMRARILIVGMGGLGSPAALYLAAAGIGQLVIADGDSVELSNLQRQIAFSTLDIGLPKVEAAATRLRDLNPESRILPIHRSLAGADLEEQIERADLVLDCSDNFNTRFAINRDCVRYSKPLVSGAVIRFEGQLAVFDARRGDSPCYHCLYPEQDEQSQTCTNNGVITPLPGIIGSLQALEAIKLLSGAGSPSHGRLLLFDALHLNWHTVVLKQNPDCSVCAKTPLAAPAPWS